MPDLPVPPPAAPRRRFRGTLAYQLPEWEQERILYWADRIGVDPVLLGAIRIAENGGPGREFGVLSVPAPTYDDQARIAAQTIVANIDRYEGRRFDGELQFRCGSIGQSATDASGAVTDAFIRCLALVYAPPEAHPLNVHWPANVIAAYETSDVGIA